jgi:argininosuccinate lyase
LALKHTHEGSIGDLRNEEIKIMMQNIVSKFEFEKTDKALQSLLEFKVT